jgi:hypothetical protein
LDSTPSFVSRSAFSLASEAVSDVANHELVVLVLAR